MPTSRAVAKAAYPSFQRLIAMALGVALSATPASAAPLPWEREILLREGAKSVFLTGKLHPTNPQPAIDSYPVGPAFQISNPAVRSSLWGPVDHVTLSLIKNDIWDRRIPKVKYTAPTLAEIIAGANAPINKDLTTIKPEADSTRPVDWGYLRKEGGRYNPYLDGPRYPFPTAKPAGQIILSIAALKGTPVPELAQNCGDGVVRFHAGGKTGGADLEYALSMTDNVYAIRGSWRGGETAASLRLYRHRDTGHYGYMSPDGKSYTAKNHQELYEADKEWNGALAAPASGQDGQYFWIRQRMPAEKTFPQGFEYVMAGTVRAPTAARLETVENQIGLGTPVPDKNITAAPGAAATAAFSLAAGAEFQAFVVVVTTEDANGGDLMVEAKRRLAAAAKIGFEGVRAENAQWYGRLYDQRENGRIFLGDTGKAVSDDVQEIFRSWYCTHGGATSTDMRKYQASAHYVTPEHDAGMYGSLPCYNEVFYTPQAVRNRSDSTLMWKQLVEHWMPAARQNAREVYGMPGMFLTHGFLPPIKPDRYVHTNVALELAVDTQAQVLKTLWDEWDYGGDPKVLAEIYSAMRDMALFYAAYAKKGDDGVYHIIPAAQEESWGIQPGFSHSRDTIAAITMFRWGLTRAAEAATTLHCDAELARDWLEVAAHLPPYPTWEKPQGLIFAGMPGVEPWRGKGEHPWDIGTYPTVLADDVNLDSDATTRATMVRTARVLRAGLSDRAAVLLGVNPPPPKHGDRSARALYLREPERLLNSRSGRIHLFPTLVPKAGRVAFRNFQARGGFLVSACRSGKGVTFLQIEARRDASCQVLNPWPGRKIAIRSGEKEIPFTTDTTNGECLVFDAQARATYRFSPR